jgi:pyruvate/2-oxoglutarate dehydrogenase complex dihydrolipoamide dehydrogenase (E3) component
LGVDVEVFEQADHVAALHDVEVANELKLILGAELPMHFNVRLDVAASGHLARIEWSGASSGAKSFERVLVATGRPPALGDLNLAATGIPLDDHGVPQVNDTTLQCGDAPIFLAGDVDGSRPVLHEAVFEGCLAGRNAATFPNVQKSKRAVPLSITFTDPPLAVVGAPPTDKSVIGTASYADQGRAKSVVPVVVVARILPSSRRSSATTMRSAFSKISRVSMGDPGLEIHPLTLVRHFRPVSHRSGWLTLGPVKRMNGRPPLKIYGKRE